MQERLRGSYEESWDASELQASAAGYFERGFGAPLDPRAVDLLGMLAGDYRLDLGDSSYRITRNPGAQEFCTGSVTPVGDRLLLSADRGSWCLDFHYAEVGWELGEDELWLPREQFRGPTVDLLLWTGKPLRRVG